MGIQSGCERNGAHPPMKKIILTLVLLSELLLVTAADRGMEAQRPNFIFILTDDQRFDSLGCMGNGLIRTPNLDRLAKNGVLFTNHFVTTPICSVSRASIFLGQHLKRHRIGDFVTPFSREQWAQSYPARLRAAGYRTGFIGKFGVGSPEAIAAMKDDFDYWNGLPGQAGRFFIPPESPNGSCRR